MKVYKFGGASIKNASAIVNVGKILQNESGPLVIVISAMGKMTNKLERLVALAFERNEQYFLLLWEDIRLDHLAVAEELGIKKQMELKYDLLHIYIHRIVEEYIHGDSVLQYDELYDQLIFLGEWMSTQLVQNYLNENAFPVTWMDARDFIQTDCNFRMASIDWDKTIRATQNELVSILTEKGIVVTQGFIGRCSTGKTTSLGREGSDYTAAILAYCLDAESVTVWKDVPGVLTADPRKVENAQLIDNLTFRDAIELTYYGAQVIHPKTIQPLQKKNIPLYVRSFIDYQGTGTRIHNVVHDEKPPMIVITEDQYLIHIASKDYSFIAEQHLSTIFRLLNDYRIRVNLMRNTAISFSVSVSAEKDRFESFIRELRPLFQVDVTSHLTLITIRHYDEKTIERFKGDKDVLFEERHGITHQMIVK